LTSLTRLDLRWNPLTTDSLPSEIGSLASLEVLVCGEDAGDRCNCKNFIGWADAERNDCEVYDIDDDDDSDGWSVYIIMCEDSERFKNADGISAKEACCVCGGGTNEDGGE